MLVSGYQIREATHRHELARDTAAQLFKKSTFAFSDDEPLDPKKVMEDFQSEEHAVVRLQEAQQRYNLLVTVNVQGVEMTLGAAVKSLGGAGRAEKMWRETIIIKDRYGSTVRDMERSKDTLVAKRVVGINEATKLANKAAGYAGALRAAVATGNATKVEIESLDESLFS